MLISVERTCREFHSGTRAVAVCSDFSRGIFPQLSFARERLFYPMSGSDMAEALETIAIPATNLHPTRIALGTWAIGESDGQTRDARTRRGACFVP